MAKKSEFVKCWTPNFRVSFPALDEPKLGPDGTGEPKYSVRCLVPKNCTGKDAELLKKLREECKNSALKFWEVDDPAKLPKALKKPIKDGDESEYEGEHGYWVFNARTTQRPGVVDAKCRDLSKEEIKDQVYAGCWARATVLVGSTDRAGSKCVFLILSNLQKIKDDTPFGNRRKASEEFEAVEFSEAGEEFTGAEDEGF